MKKFLKIIGLFVLLVFLYFFFTIGQFFIPGVGVLMYPLHAAAYYNVTPIVRVLSYTPLLNSKKPDLKGYSTTPIRMAAYNGSHESVEILLNRGASAGTDVLRAGLAHPELLKYLIEERGISPNVPASDYVDPVIFDTLTCNYKGKYAARNEAYRQSLEILLQNGANPNVTKKHTKNNNSPLHISMRSHCFENIKLLLKYGATPETALSDIKADAAKMKAENGPTKRNQIFVSISIVEKFISEKKNVR